MKNLYVNFTGIRRRVRHVKYYQPVCKVKQVMFR